MSSIAVTIIDRKYVHWASVLTISIARNSPEIELHLLAIDLEESDIIMLYDHGCSHVEPIEQVFESPASIVNARAPLLMNYWAQRCPNSAVLLLDADFLIRSSLQPLFTGSATFDAAVCFRPGIYQGQKFKRLTVAGGLVLFQPSGRRLLEQWVARMAVAIPIEDVCPGEWFWDQACLADVTETADVNIMPIPFPQYLSSPPFESGAALWSANVKPWEKTEIYRRFLAELSM